MTQLKWMFKQRRIFATLGYIGSIILTFIAAFVVNNFIAVLFCVILQFAALGYVRPSKLESANRDFISFLPVYLHIHRALWIKVEELL